MKLSDEFEKRICESVKGLVPEETLNKFLSIIDFEIAALYKNQHSKNMELEEGTLLSGETRNRVEKGLLRLFSSMMSLSSFVKESVIYLHFLPTIVKVIANSNYLQDILVRNPEYLYWLLTNGGLEKRLCENVLNDEITKNLSAFNTFNAKVGFLIRLKRREILRIGTRDLNGLDSISETTQQLSILAKQLLSSLFNICYQQLLEERGYNSTGEDSRRERIKRKFVVISLGKLGGMELNYSSDADLMIIIDKNLKIGYGLSYYEFVSDVIKLFAEKASGFTNEGYLYRVDFRLRPDGKNSPVCRTLSDTLSYYETRGEEWEKQMLIKMSLLTGDKGLYQKFSNSIKSFIYSADPFRSVAEQVYSLRKLTTSNYSNELNIKQSKGGLRDIEFPVQVLQMIHGKRQQLLQTGNTFEAIQRLSENKLLSVNEEIVLTEAYSFFRRIEHYLQLLNDRQTHTIPEFGNTLEMMALYFGYSANNEFLSEVKKYMSGVTKFAESVYFSENKEDVAEKEYQISENFINEIKFQDFQKAEKSLLYLREGIGLLEKKDFDKITTKAFLKIEPQLMTFLADSGSPDTVLNNFVRIIKNARFPSIWYETFKSENIFRAFLKLCENSQKAIDLFAEDKQLRELFLNGTVFEPITSENIAGFSMKEITFILLVQYTNGLTDSESVGKILSASIRIKINLAAEDFQRNFNSVNFFIAGMGSFSVGQMTFKSDVDIIFVSEATTESKDIQRYFVKLLEQIRIRTAPFKVDCRLRPEGNSSLIIWSLDSYRKYLEKRAKIWEFQALTKLSFIYGDYSLFSIFTLEIISKVSDRTSIQIKQEIKDMRKRISDSEGTYLKMFSIKKSKGGIIDIEFAIQFLLMKNSDAFKQLQGLNIRMVTEGLKKYFNEFSEEIDLLFKNYQFLINLYVLIQSIFNQSSDNMPNDLEKTKTLSSMMGFNNVDSFEKELKEVRNSNVQIFEFLTEGK